MILAFKLSDDIGNGDREFNSPKMKNKYTKKYNCLTKEENMQMKEGFQLFIKYFHSLWD